MLVAQVPERPGRDPGAGVCFCCDAAPPGVLPRSRDGATHARGPEDVTRLESHGMWEVFVGRSLGGGLDGVAWLKEGEWLPEPPPAHHSPPPRLSPSPSLPLPPTPSHIVPLTPLGNRRGRFTGSLAVRHGTPILQPAQPSSSSDRARRVVERPTARSGKRPKRTGSRGSRSACSTASEGMSGTQARAMVWQHQCRGRTA